MLDLHFEHKDKSVLLDVMLFSDLIHLIVVVGDQIGALVDWDIY